jgi:predicted MFS family arabinose efflux permease
VRRAPAWVRAASALFGVGWGANQFASLLLAYRDDRHLSVSTAQALFGVYAVGLIPALLIGGPLSDRWGRRRVAIPAALASVLATAVLVLGDHSVAALYAGRFLAGVSSGAMFAAGTAWVKELSMSPFDASAGEQAGARRAAIALSAGFGFGPVIAGVIAQWAPDPLLTAYVPHLLVMGLVLVAISRVPETVRSEHRATRVAGMLRVAAAGHPRFLAVVTPLAPWVFTAPSISFAVLPGLVAAHTHGYAIAFSALSAGVTLGFGVLVQPLARRLDAVDDARGAAAGLTAIVAGLLVGAVAAHEGSWPAVLVAATALGSGYGLCLVSGLLEVQRIAPPEQLAGLTAVFYALTYVGFAAPIVLAELAHETTYTVLLLGAAVLALATLLIVTTQARRRSSGAGGAQQALS